MPSSPYDFFTSKSSSHAGDPFGGIDFTGGQKLFDPIQPNKPPITSPIGSLVPGGTGSNPSGATQSGPNWWDNNSSKVGGATQAFLPLLFSMFGNNEFKDATKQSADKLSALADQLTKAGADLTGDGKQALLPVLQHLIALTGADPAALFQATQPERSRVMDQYDTARKAIQFLPRGGGQASATMDAGAKEASDISTIIANARNGAFGQLGTLGSGLLTTGLNTSASGGYAQQAAGNAYGQLSKQEDDQLGGFGSMLGTAISTALMFL